MFLEPIDNVSSMTTMVTILLRNSTTVLIYRTFFSAVVVNFRRTWHHVKKLSNVVSFFLLARFLCWFNIWPPGVGGFPLFLLLINPLRVPWINDETLSSYGRKNVARSGGAFSELWQDSTTFTILMKQTAQRGKGFRHEGHISALMLPCEHAVVAEL